MHQISEWYPLYTNKFYTVNSTRRYPSRIRLNIRFSQLYPIP